MYYRWRGMLGYREDGRPNRRELYARTQKELRQKVDQLLQDHKAGIRTPPKRLTLSAWLDQWLSECCADVKERSRITYQSMIETHIKPGIGGIPLAELSPMDVQRFINGLDGLSPKSCKNVHGVLHRALQRALEWRYIAVNPADGCALPRIERHEVNFLAGDDLRRFLAACDGEYAPLMRLAVYTGMREGEILGLEWGSVDFERETITVRQQLQLIKGEYRIVSTKSDKTRTLTPPKQVFDLLRDVHRDQAAQKLRMGTDWITDHDFVFTRYDGRNVARNTLYMNFKRTLAAAGLPETTRFHDLRHSFAVFALEAGDNVKEVQSALGHYSSAFTMDVYGHVSEEARKASAKRQQAALDELMRHG